MAREKHSNGSYQLVKGRKENVESNVYTLRVIDADGSPVTIKPERLKDENGAYKYRKVVSVPCIADGASDENIGELIQQFASDLSAYDSATEIVSVDGTKRGTRWMPLCVDTKGNPISAGQYLARLLDEAHRLAIQKRLYKPLHEQATKDFREADAIGEPAKKARAAKKAEVEGEEEFAA
jgi:hypothetical protein